MKRYVKIWLLVTMMAGMWGCKSDQKIVSYNGIYNESPTTIYIAPVQDKTPRVKEETQGDRANNKELDVAAKYMYQTMALPMLQQGYYVIPPLASKQIAEREDRTPRQQQLGDLTNYERDYNIDAILYPTIHKWSTKDGGVVVYVEYVMKSTKTGSDLMHVWVKGHKRNATNFKGEPIPLQSDLDFAIDMGLTDGEAQRCILLKQISSMVLLNLPVSANRRQFRDDQYNPANPNYFLMFSNESGENELLPISMDNYEIECFADELQ